MSGDHSGFIDAFFEGLTDEQRMHLAIHHRVMHNDYDENDKHLMRYFSTEEEAKE